MAQNINAPKREEHKDSEEWFDLRSLAPREDSSETPVEVWPGRKARAYYAPAPADDDGLEVPPQPAATHVRKRDSGFLDTYGPLLYFTFLVLVPIAGGLLFFWSPPDPPPEAQAVEGGMQERVDPAVAERSTALPSHVRPHTVLRVDSDPEGAYVYVDGALAGITPYRDDAIESGWRTVMLKLSDHDERDTLVYVDPEMETTLALLLDPLPEDPALAATPGPDLPVEAAPAPQSAAPTVPARAVGELRIETTPDRAVVRLDGTTVGRSPLLLRDLDPGTYEVTLSLPGYETHSRRVDVGPGRRAALRAELAALTGTLSILVHPWGAIYVDDTLLARDTDLRRSIDVAAGPHVIRVEHPVLGVQERTVEVRAGQTTSVDFDLL